MTICAVRQNKMVGGRHFSLDEARNIILSDEFSDDEDMDMGETDQEYYAGDADSDSDSENHQFASASSDSQSKDSRSNVTHDQPEPEDLPQDQTANDDESWVWKKLNTFTPSPLHGTPQEQLNEELPPDPRPIHFFQMYLTLGIMNMIVEETNRYAKQFLHTYRDNLKPNSNFRNWVDTDVLEMTAFLALVFLMGVVHKPRIHMYWTTDELFATSIFGKVMARDRFYQLLHFLHLINNEDYDDDARKNDRLYKVRNFVNAIKTRCKAVYAPCKNICLDESLLPFKGRLAFKQYIPIKRCRYGIKFFELCTYDGILLDFNIYHGGLREEMMQVPNFSYTENIVTSLLQEYLNRGHTVFLDNFYTTPRLAKYLIDHGTALTGTVRANRKNFPKDLCKENTEKGDFVFYSCENVLSVKYRSWQDKSDKKPKVVHMLTTCHTTSSKATKKKNYLGDNILKPDCIIDYNHNMGGVDLGDQQLHQWQVLRKTYKWYKKVMLRLLMKCMLSSFKLHNKYAPKKFDFLGYVHDVIKELVLSAPKLHSIPKVPQDETLERLTGREHFPVRRAVESQHRKKKSLSKPCRVCWARGLRTPKGKQIETVWVCSACPSQPGLHIDQDCFKAYHTQLDYSVCIGEE